MMGHENHGNEKKMKNEKQNKIKPDKGSKSMRNLDKDGKERE